MSARGSGRRIHYYTTSRTLTKNADSDSNLKFILGRTEQKIMYVVRYVQVLVLVCSVRNNNSVIRILVSCNIHFIRITYRHNNRHTKYTYLRVVYLLSCINGGCARGAHDRTTY